MDHAKPTQVANQEPNIVENVDALKSQTVETHSHPGRPNVAYLRYQPRVHRVP